MISPSSRASKTFQRNLTGIFLLLLLLIVTVALFTGTEAVAEVAGPNPCLPSDLDPSFGTGGTVTTQFSSSYDDLTALALQSDGKLVAAGLSSNGSNIDFGLARYNPDGSLDNTFGIGGKVTTSIGSGNDQPYDLAIQSDGKIVVIGLVETPAPFDIEFGVVRYNTNGSLDASFGTGGKVVTNFGAGTQDYPSGVVVQPDGKIVVAGNSGPNATQFNSALVRYNSNGSLDPSFGTAGKAVIDVSGSGLANYIGSLVLQPDNKIVAVGGIDTPASRDFAIARFNQNGSLDATFGTGGATRTDISSDSTDFSSSIAMQADGKFVIAGSFVNSSPPNSTYNTAAVRYNANGTIDASFGTGGKVTFDLSGINNHDGAQAVAILPDGKIVLAGGSDNASAISHFALARLTENGSLDPSFDGDGKVVTSLASTRGYADALIVQPDGKLVAAGGITNGGNTLFSLARFGIIPCPSVSVSVSPLAVQENGANLVYTFTRSGGFSGGLTVNYTLSGSGTLTNFDFLNPPTLGPNAVNFAPGSSTTTAIIDPISDPFVEPDETVTMTITAGSGYIIGAPSAATGTIINDDTDIFCSIGANSVAEDGAGNLIYNCTRTGVMASALAVPFTLGGTATFPSDYTVQGNVSGVSPSGGTLNFGAGSSSASIVVDPTPDAVVENDETVVVTFASGPNFNVNPNPTVLTGVIVNDDTDVSVAVSLTNPVAAGSSVLEDGAQNLLYTFTRNTTPSVLGQPLTINFTTTGDATSGTDFTQSVTGTIVFAAGSATASLIVDPTPDSTVEPDEQVIVTVTSGTGYNVGSPTIATGTILNDDVVNPGILQFSSASISQVEGSASATVTVTRSGGSSGTVGIQYATLINGSATAGAVCTGNADFITANGTLTFPAGVTTQNVVIALCDDAIFEGDESFNVVLSNPTGGASLGNPSSATVTITDNDLAPTLTVNDITVSENAGSATFTVTQSAPSALMTTFTVATGFLGDTALQNTDYLPISGQRTIPAGSTSVTISVPLINDTFAEPSETFSLLISSPISATIVDARGVATILDDDSGGCPATPIAYGETHNGVLTEASCVIPGEGRVDLYSFAGTAGQRVVVNMISGGSFQARLQLMSPTNASLGEVSGQPSFNDARLPTTSSFQLPASGVYTIRAKELFLPPGPDQPAVAEAPEGPNPNIYSLSLNLVPAGGCAYSFAPRTNAVAAGGDYSLFVVSQPGCPMTDPLSQTGVFYQNLTYRNGLIRFTVPQNPNSTARQETITIAGQLHTINQYGTAIPSNDNLINAQSISGANSLPGEIEEIALPDAPAEGYNAAATAEPGEPPHSANPAARSVWYSWTAPGPLDGLYSFTTSGSSFDTVMAIYECPVTGLCNFSTFTRVGSNDDTTFYDKTSKVNFRATSGRRYVISIDGKNGATGTIRLNWHSYIRLYRLYLQNFSGFPSSFVPTALSASNGQNTVLPFLVSQGVYEFSLPDDGSTYIISITGPAGIVWSPNNIPIGNNLNHPSDADGGLDGAQNVVSNAADSSPYRIIGYIKNLGSTENRTLRMSIANAQGPNVQPARDCPPPADTAPGFPVVSPAGVNYTIYECESRPETNHQIVPARPMTRFRLPVRALPGYVTGPDAGSIGQALVASIEQTNKISGQVLFGGAGTQIDLKFTPPGINGQLGLGTLTGANGSFEFPNLEPGITYNVTAVRTGVQFTQPPPVQLLSDQIVNIPAVACTFTPGAVPQVSGAGGPVRIDITTNNPTCEWTTSTNNPEMITINDGEFPGNGPINLTVKPNPGGARMGSIRLLGRTDPIIIQQSAGSGPNIEGDVVDGSGNPTGDGLILANDVAAIRQLVLGILTINTTTNQFQRADANLPCGNGLLESGDVTVIRGMVLGTVPNNTPACGPTQPTALRTLADTRIYNSNDMGSALDTALERLFGLQGTLFLGQAEHDGDRVIVPVEIDSPKLVTAISFSLSFDDRALEYLGTRLGTDATPTSVLTTDQRAANRGKIAVLIDSATDYLGGKHRIALIQFKVKDRGIAQKAEISFGGLPVFSGAATADGTLIECDLKDGQILLGKRFGR